MTNGTTHLHLRQKVHFDSQCASAFAAFTAPTGNIERKMTCGDLVLFRFKCGGESFPDGREGIGIGRCVRAREASNMSLIDRDDLVDVLPACDRVMLARDL